MKKKFKTVITGIFIFAMAVIIGLRLQETEVKAELTEEIYTTYSGKLVFYDEDEGSYIYQTKGRKATTNIFYRTFALEFSRIRQGIDPIHDEPYASDVSSMTDADPHYYKNAFGYWNSRMDKTRESFYVDYKEANKEQRDYKYDSNIQIVTYSFNEDLLLHTLNQYHGGWYNELTTALEEGKEAFMGVDCIILVNDPTQYTVDPISGNAWSGSFFVEPGTHKASPSGIVFSWATQGALNGRFHDTITNFNSYVPFGKSETEESAPSQTITPSNPAPATGTHWLVKNAYDSSKNNTTTESGDNKAAPATHTYNYSTVFDVGTAIPSSESYTNGISIDSWYGRVGVSLQNVTYPVSVTNAVLKNYYDTTVTDSYIDTVPRQEGTFNIGASSVTVECKDLGDGTYLITTTKTDKASVVYTIPEVKYFYQDHYYRISKINLYEFTEANVFNDSFGTVRYNIDPNITYRATISGTTVSNGDGSVFSTDTFTVPSNPASDPHVTLPNIAPADLTYNETKNTTYKITPEGATAIVKQEVQNRLDDYQLTCINDELMLNGTTYMTQNSLGFTFTNNGQTNIGRESNDKVQSEQNVTIPVLTPNGYYYTTLKSTYKRMVAGSGNKVLTKRDMAGSIPAILSGYQPNEPVVVHSPVIAPISIQGEPEVQDVNPVLQTQFILDNTYNIHFNWAQYFHYKGYDNPAGWTKYVLDKEVRFPFAVKLNGTYYDVHSGSGYTDWISVGNVTDFTFYIPSWAKEGVYGKDGYSGYNANPNPIQVRVYANNSPGHEIMQEYEYNADLDNYVATYNYPVQISGIIYDFKVTGVNDEQLFGGYDRETGIYSFVNSKEEKRVGTNNRFGTNTVRYTLDGTLTNNWPLSNTLPFINGKSNALSDMGYLIKGHTFGFTLKTISVLNKTTDTIEITPEYRFVATDGTVYEADEISLFYDTATEALISPNSDRDKAAMQPVSLNSLYFDNCYYDYGAYDTIAYTANKYGKTEHNVMDTKTNSYNFGSITLYSTQKLLTGNEEELDVNKAADVNTAQRYGHASGLGNLSSSQYDAFRSSMQTWYGCYQIPDQLYVCLKNPAGSPYADKLEEYIASNGSVTADSDCWLKSGWLVLNFDIDSYVEGEHAHLTYHAGTKSLWDLESGLVPDDADADGIYDVNDIPLRDGDVAIISIDKNLSGRYETGILYLN